MNVWMIIGLIYLVLIILITLFGYLMVKYNEKYKKIFNKYYQSRNFVNCLIFSSEIIFVFIAKLAVLIFKKEES